MSTKNVRTKVNKDARIEFRCTNAFKAQLEEIAVRNGTKVSKLIERLCTEEIKRNLPIHESDHPQSLEHRKNEHGALIKATTKTQRVELIRECYEKGMNCDETVMWLNKNGYTSQRGPFTANSVRSIVKRNGIKQ